VWQATHLLRRGEERRSTVQFCGMAWHAGSLATQRIGWDGMGWLAMAYAATRAANDEPLTGQVHSREEMDYQSYRARARAC